MNTPVVCSSFHHCVYNKIPKSHNVRYLLGQKYNISMKRKSKSLDFNTKYWCMGGFEMRFRESSSLDSR